MVIQLGRSEIHCATRVGNTVEIIIFIPSKLSIKNKTLRTGPLARAEGLKIF